MILRLQQRWPSCARICEVAGGMSDWGIWFALAAASWCAAAFVFSVLSFRGEFGSLSFKKCLPVLAKLLISGAVIFLICSLFAWWILAVF